MLQKSIACFQERHLFLVLFNVTVLLWNASAEMSGYYLLF
jgi:hypothetical protein